jgi:hypothetical protein
LFLRFLPPTPALFPPCWRVRRLSRSRCRRPRAITRSTGHLLGWAPLFAADFATHALKPAGGIAGYAALAAQSRRMLDPAGASLPTVRFGSFSTRSTLARVAVAPVVWRARITLPGAVRFCSRPSPGFGAGSLAVHAPHVPGDSVFGQASLSPRDSLVDGSARAGREAADLATYAIGVGGVRGVVCGARGGDRGTAVASRGRNLTAGKRLRKVDDPSLPHASAFPQLDMSNGLYQGS